MCVCIKLVLKLMEEEEAVRSEFFAARAQFG